jgi:hypothetical protein
LPRDLKIASSYLFQFVWSQRRQGRRVAAATPGKSSCNSIIARSEGEVGCNEQVEAYDWTLPRAKMCSIIEGLLFIFLGKWVLIPTGLRREGELSDSYSTIIAELSLV